jgi:hypothetical protein
MSAPPLSPTRLRTRRVGAGVIVGGVLFMVTGCATTNVAGMHIRNIQAQVQARAISKSQGSAEIASENALAGAGLGLLVTGFAAMAFAPCIPKRKPLRTVGI